MKKTIKTNILIFLIAIPLAIGLFFLLDESDLLSASVISLQEHNAMKQNRRDLGYKNEGNILDVYLDDEITDLDYVTVSIIYDDQNISFDLEDLQTQGDYEIVSNESGNLLIQFKNFAMNNYDFQNSLFELKFTGDVPSILVSEAIAFMFSGNNRLLAIGSLNGYKDSHD